MRFSEEKKLADTLYVAVVTMHWGIPYNISEAAVLSLRQAFNCAAYLTIY